MYHETSGSSALQGMLVISLISVNLYLMSGPSLVTQCVQNDWLLDGYFVNEWPVLCCRPSD